jgi:hypothetical protein
MSDILDVLGIEDSEFHWRYLALCQGMNSNDFHDRYEADPEHAKAIDDLCLSCPVRKECLLEGVQNNEWGVWGGWFLVNGKIDETKNQHKTQAVADALRSFE